MVSSGVAAPGRCGGSSRHPHLRRGTSHGTVLVLFTYGSSGPWVSPDGFPHSRPYYDLDLSPRQRELPGDDACSAMFLPLLFHRDQALLRPIANRQCLFDEVVAAERPTGFAAGVNGLIGPLAPNTELDDLASDCALPFPVGQLDGPQTPSDVSIREAKSLLNSERADSEMAQPPIQVVVDPVNTA